MPRPNQAVVGSPSSPLQALAACISQSWRVSGGTPINYLIRWIQQYQIHKGPSDFVFAPFDSGKKSARDIYYHNYKSLRIDLKEVGLEWFDTYHCRHWWVTNKLYAKEPIYFIAKAAGTSVKEIERTYSHVLTDLITKEFGKTRVAYRSDGTPVALKVELEDGGAIESDDDPN